MVEFDNVRELTDAEIDKIGSYQRLLAAFFLFAAGRVSNPSFMALLVLVAIQLHLSAANLHPDRCRIVIGWSR